MSNSLFKDALADAKKLREIAEQNAKNSIIESIAPKIPEMNEKQIIGAIMLATGKKVEEVAKDNGYSKHTFYRAINGKTNSPTVQALISSITGRPIDEIWPPEKA